MSKSHVNHSVDLSGVILNPDFPYLGASPDGIVNCSCCGVGCLEIKCPSKYREPYRGYDIWQLCLFGIWQWWGGRNNKNMLIIIKYKHSYLLRNMIIATSLLC